MVLRLISADELREVGLYVIGYVTTSTQPSINEERFCACFGASAKAYAAIWRDIQREELGESQIVTPKAEMFLITLYWLKAYQTATRMEAIFGWTKKTI